MRAFRGASLAMFLFSLSFGAMLLSIVLWTQGVWGWSALKAGLAIAPGPLMVPLFGLLLAGRLIARFGAGPVAGVGATLFGLGLAWWAVAIGPEPDYVGDMLGGMLVTGIGVGLTLPTLMSTAAGALGPQAFATGSAVVNTLRQIGLAIGVAGLVALLGATPDLAAFQQAWWVFAGVSVLAGARPPLASRRAVRVAFSILGSLEIRHDGQPLELAGTRRRALIAALLLRPNETVSADALMEALWGKHAANALQANISRVRRDLGPVAERLHTEGGGYRLEVRDDELDATRFEAALAHAQTLRADPAAAKATLEQALALWRGPVLAELGLEAFAHNDVRRLEELRLTAIEERIDAELALGEHPIAALEALVAEHPLRERLRGQLMLALSGAGRHADALASLPRCAPGARRARDGARAGVARARAGDPHPRAPAGDGARAADPHDRPRAGPGADRRAAARTPAC